MGGVPQGVCPHPTALALGDRLAMVLVEDQPDATRPIIFGEPSQGWAGDPRMALYYYPRATAKDSTYVLCRVCDNGEYRIIMELPANDRPLSPAGVNLAIRRLIAMDTHRGFDPHKAITAHNDRLEADRTRRNDEWVDEEAAPRLAWAFGRDRAAHLGGRFDHHKVGSVPWHDKPGAAQPEVS